MHRLVDDVRWDDLLKDTDSLAVCASGRLAPDGTNAGPMGFGTDGDELLKDIN